MPKPLGRLMISGVLITFPEIFVPEPIRGGEPAFSASFIMRPDHPQVQEIVDEMRAICAAKWLDRAEAVYDEMYAQDRLALHSGLAKARYPLFANNLYIAARAKASQPPTVIDGERNPITGGVKHGNVCNVSVDLWAQDNKHGKRINANLRGVQVLAGGAVASATAVGEFA